MLAGLSLTCSAAISRFTSDEGRVHLIAGKEARTGGGDVHAHVLQHATSSVRVWSSCLQQHAHASTQMNVGLQDRNQRCRSSPRGEGRWSWPDLRDFALDEGHDFLAVACRASGQLLGQFADEGLEVVVLGHEVGFAVHLDQHAG